MAKEISGYLKLQVKGGQANPAPPIGPALGSKGLSIVDFCKQFNDRTKNQPGVVLPVVVTIYTDRTFTFVIKTPPARELILEAAGIKQGSAEPNRTKVGTITWEQAQAIGKKKLRDLNALEIDAAARQVAGTARSMGVQVTGMPTPA